VRRIVRGAAWAAGLAVLLLAARSEPVDAARASRVVVSDEGVLISDGDRDTLIGDTIVVGGRTTIRTTDDHRGFNISVDDDGSGLVRIFSDASVGAGERVFGDVVAVFGSVDVAGIVTGDVVAVFGSVRLQPGASVNGDVVAVGGRLHQEEGSQINGETVSVSFLPFEWGVPPLNIILGAIAAGWLVTTLCGALFAWVAPTRMLRVAVTCSRRTAASLVLGVISVPLMLMAVVLLLVTVIGIPLAVLLPVAFALMGFAGQIVATYVLGSKLMRRRLGEGNLIPPFVVGNTFVAAMFALGMALAVGAVSARPFGVFFMSLALLLHSGLGCIGTGAFLLSRLGARPADVTLPGDPTASSAVPVGAIPSPPVGA
jgi:hypothetical protein